jgi:hypothetical protein
MRESTSTESGGRREVSKELVAGAIGVGGALRKPVAELLEAHSRPEIEVRSTSAKGNYGKIIDSIPVEGGELEIEVERLEFTNTGTGEKTHQAWITVGHSKDPTVIDLPPDRVQSASSTLDYRLRNGQYDTRVVDGIVKIIPRDLDFLE